MATLYVTHPKRQQYLVPYTSDDRKNALLKVIEAHAPEALKLAKIKPTMTYDEIENRLVNDYLDEYPLPMFPQYFDVFIKKQGKFVKLF